MNRINSKKDLQDFLEADRVRLKKNYKSPKLFSDDIWRFQILLRKCEYYKNCRKDVFGKLIYKYWRYQLARKSISLGFSIPLNCFGPGLCIKHYGTIVINGNTTIGANCTIHVCVNIGSKPNELKSPIIGDDAYIAPGAKLYGDIVLGDNVFIGANAVVNKSFPDGNVTLVGIPAKPINA